MEQASEALHTTPLNNNLVVLCFGDAFGRFGGRFGGHFWEVVEGGGRCLDSLGEGV